MPTLLQPLHAAPAPAPLLSTFESWTLHEYQAVDSTNLIAATLPAWTAVRADTQSAGRGRFQRSWISDQGGLWLSAVVPSSPGKLARRALPLAAGLAICNALQELGVQGFRLRWPNDVLVNDQKLAGLLIDQFAPGLAVVGIGINVGNQPDVQDASLKNCSIRLADLLPTPPKLSVLTDLILRRLRTVLLELNQQSAPALFLRVNQLWGPPHTVELDLDGTLRRGLFTGVDSEGRLRLADLCGNLSFYDAHQVRHLTEI
jgi:BirA family biotin operon repressor/biotin-[acetyl-CoA-carboxylase] ligase